MLAQGKHYAQRFFQLGPKKASYLFVTRLHKKIHTYALRQKALHKKAAHDWRFIQRVHNLEYSFGTFFQQKKDTSLSFISSLYESKTSDELFIERADFFAKNGVDLLGSGPHFFKDMPWHTDFRLRMHNPDADCDFDATIFYQDIYVKAGEAQLLKDIKVPWELSRFYHFFVLGKAYALTNDQKYVDTFVRHVDDWLTCNPYLLGVNWLCPMEVGLRALNWIVAYEFFKNDQTIPSDFWQRFVCSLYDHLIYLEHNWEVYDGRTSNHYLSNLVGYVYLCWFFKNLNGVQEKLNWCYHEIITESEKQVFADGTDYESSTKYHRLVTELLYHAYLIFLECGLSVPVSFAQKLQRMFDFIEWCTPVGGELIMIGDDDSGRVLYFGLPTDKDCSFDSASLSLRTNGREEKQLNFTEVKNFSQFGLSIIKTPTWHISLRHHAYQHNQPSGHFHNDVGSITLAINGVPVIVDPGSFTYTPSAHWRNYFRSVDVHNTFFLQDVQPVSLDDRLFMFDLPENKNHFEPKTDDDTIQVKTEHDLYARFGLRAQREIFFTEEKNKLMLSDTWLMLKNQPTERPHSCWNFTLAPNITVKKRQNGWMLLHHGKPIVELQSDVHFDQYKAWVSPQYGIKKQTIGLRAVARVSLQQEVNTTLTFVSN